MPVRKRRSGLDVVLVRAESAWKALPAFAWHTLLSDHAFMKVSFRAQATAASAACTPSALRQLPLEAHADLRRAFYHLEVRFGLNRMSETRADGHPGDRAAREPMGGASAPGGDDQQ